VRRICRVPLAQRPRLRAMGPDRKWGEASVSFFIEIEIAVSRGGQTDAVARSSDEAAVSESRPPAATPSEHQKGGGPRRPRRPPLGGVGSTQR